MSVSNTERALLVATANLARFEATATGLLPSPTGLWVWFGDVPRPLAHTLTRYEFVDGVLGPHATGDWVPFGAVAGEALRPLRRQGGSDD